MSEKLQRLEQETGIGSDFFSWVGKYTYDRQGEEASEFFIGPFRWIVHEDWIERDFPKTGELYVRCDKARNVTHARWDCEGQTDHRDERGW